MASDTRPTLDAPQPTAVQVLQISDVAQDCWDSFSKLSDKLGTEVPVTQRLVTDYQQRYESWLGYLGVFAQERLSLDHRLRNSPEIKSLVVQQLVVAKRNLNEASELVSRKYVEPAVNKDNELAGKTDSEIDRVVHLVEKDNVPQLSPVLKATFLGIEGALDRLHRLGAAIRQASSRQLMSRSHLVAGDDRLKNFEALAYGVLEALYPAANPKLLEHICTSMTQKYETVLYLEARKNKYQPVHGAHRAQSSWRPKLTGLREMPIEESHDGVGAESAPEQHADAATSRPVHTTSRRNIRPSEMSSAFSEGEFKRNYQPTVQPSGHPRRPTASIATGTAVYVPAQTLHDNAKFADCNWCFRNYPAEMYTTPEKWRQHQKEDWKPYVCLFQECARNAARDNKHIASFAHSFDWQTHMEKHSVEWSREIYKPPTWVCSLDIDPVTGQQKTGIFASEADFLEHLKKEHPKYTPDRQQSMVRHSILFLSRDKNICPLCCFSADEDEIAPSASPPAKTVSDDIAKEDAKAQTEAEDDAGGEGPDKFTGSRRMAKHVADHLQTITFLVIRLLSLPPPSNDDEDGLSIDPGGTGKSDAAHSDYQKLIANDNNEEHTENVQNDSIEDSPQTQSASSLVDFYQGSNDIQEERSGESLAPLVNGQDWPATPSLWDRAYDALARKDAELVNKYEKLLMHDEHMEKFVSKTRGRDSALRQAQLNRVIEEGLRGIRETRDKLARGQMTQAAKLLQWAEDWFSDAVQASPQASIAWSSVSLNLPCLVEPATAIEAYRDGLYYVTTRMRYYVALEPLLHQLGQNASAADMAMSEASNRIVDLYQDILEFQLRSFLHLHQSRIKKYVRGLFSSIEYQEKMYKIKAREDMVNKDLTQIDELAARLELGALDETTTKAFEEIRALLSVSTQHSAAVTKPTEVQQDTVRQTLSNREYERLQLFRYHGASYEELKDRVPRATQGTCQWFLKHDNYHRWLAQESGSLLVTADPGCGKSVLAKFLVDRELPQHSAIICYFFFDDQSQNMVHQALCALLHQLFTKKPALIKHTMEQYAMMGSALVRAQDSLWKIFEGAVRDPQAGPIMVVLDALDECAESELEPFIRDVEGLFINNNSGNTKLRILFTTRPHPFIISMFWKLSNGFPSIHISGEEEAETISQEVKRVISYQVEQLAREQELSDEFKSMLEERLLKVEHPTHLWVYLVFDYLRTGDMVETLESADAAFQTLPATVTEAYERILDKSNDHSMAKKVFSIMLAATRPLTLSEMNVAVNVNGTLRSIQDIDLEDNIDFGTRLRSCCGWLISILDGRVHFLHPTAREFLMRSSSTAVSPEKRWQHSITARHAHTVLAEMCVLYINLFNSEDKGVSSYDDNRGAFLNYSAENWGLHFHDADMEIGSAIMPHALMLCYISSPGHTIWSSIYCRNTIELTPQCLTGLLVASYFGLESVAQLLLERGHDIESKTADGRTPLSFAAERGHDTVAKLLLNKGANIEAKDKNGRTPLSFAAERGHDAVVQLLLGKGADIEAMTDEVRGRYSI